jgi:DNA-binding transcriptional MocR family regulator
MDQDRRAVWHARIELHRRAGNLTDGMAYVARALLKRLGQDGQCDPSHETLAADSGESVSTVKRALRALLALGMVSWVRRLVRAGWRCAQTSNQYLLSLGKAPEIRGADCDAQNERETPNCNKERKVQSGTVSNIARAMRSGWQALTGTTAAASPDPTPTPSAAAQAALARAREIRQGSLQLGRTARPAVPGRLIR